MKATVYSRTDCPYCVKVKTVLTMVKAQVTEYTYETDFTKEQFHSEFGEDATFPQVVINEEHVGGCTETVKALRDRGLV